MVGTVIANIVSHFGNDMLNASIILSVLGMVLMLAIYEFLVYRFVLRRSLYNKAFNISLAVMPFFVSIIILTLQSNLVITLGTIGALAIIRFRTAIKDPIDMVFVLWSVFVGIVCGCQLYEAAVLTSLVVTIVIFVLNSISLGVKSHVLVVHLKDAADDKNKETKTLNPENDLLGIIQNNTKKYRVKSRNYTSKGMDYVIELYTKLPAELAENLKNAQFVDKFSIIEYDSEDVL